MPPKRKGKSLQSSQAPARKRTCLTTASAPISAPAEPEVAAPAPPTAKTAAKRAIRGAITKSTLVVQVPPLTKDTRAGALNSPPKPDIYDVPSESSEDELQKPAATPKVPTNGRRNKATVNGKAPSRRSRAKAVAADGEIDELASGDSPAVSKKTPTTRHTQEKDEPASGVSPAVSKKMPFTRIQEKEDETASGGSPAVGKKTPTTRRVMETEQEATPKTVVRDAKPPRTRKKGTSMRPRTKMQGKMGVGVPAGGEETTPSANRGGRRRSSAREVREEGGEHGEDEGEGEGEGDGGANAERHEADPDENVVSEQVPPAKLSTTKKRPSIGRPSLGTQGLEDPFALPSDAMEVDGAPEVEEEEDVPAVTTVEETPAPKRRIPEKLTPKASVTEPKKHENVIEVTAEAVTALQKHVLSKVMGRQRLNLVGVDEEYRYAPFPVLFPSRTRLTFIY